MQTEAAAASLLAGGVTSVFGTSPRLPKKIFSAVDKGPSGSIWMGSFPLQHRMGNQCSKMQADEFVILMLHPTLKVIWKSRVTSQTLGKSTRSLTQ